MFPAVRGAGRFSIGAVSLNSPLPFVVFASWLPPNGAIARSLPFGPETGLRCKSKQKGDAFFVCRAVIGRRHALRSLFARTDGSRAACIDSVPSRFDLNNPLNSTGRMTGHSEVIHMIAVWKNEEFFGGNKGALR